MTVEPASRAAVVAQSSSTKGRRHHPAEMRPSGYSGVARCPPADAGQASWTSALLEILRRLASGAAQYLEDWANDGVHGRAAFRGGTQEARVFPIEFGTQLPRRNVRRLMTWDLVGRGGRFADRNSVVLTTC